MKTDALEIYNNIPSQLNLAEYLLQINFEAGNQKKTAFQADDTCYSYAQIHTYVCQFADYLQSIDVRPEERIAIVLPDCIEFVIAFLGAIWHGAIPVLISEDATDRDMAYMFKDSRVRAIIATPLIQEKLYNKFTKCKWLAVDDTKKILSDLKGYNTHKIAHESSKDEAAFWVYTSGSTGNPKAVIHAHHNPIIACELYGKNILKLASKDIIYSASKMSFSYGLGATLYMSMYVGASAILSAHKKTFQLIQTINEHKPTVFFAIPHVYANILALEAIYPLATDSLRACISAAEQLPPYLWEKWIEKYGIAICEGIGTTESTHIFISNSLDFNLPGSSGKPVAGYQITLVDENGNTVKAGEIGFLKVSGEGFMLGYWNRLNETRNLLQGKTLFTGDCYYHDDNNNYFFIGRKDDLVKINGRWIAPSEIENMFMQSSFVKEVAVIVNKNAMYQTNLLTAYITLHPEYTADKKVLQEIKTYLRKNLPKYKIPKVINIVKILPRTTTGKISRRQLTNSQSEGLHEI